MPNIKCPLHNIKGILILLSLLLVSPCIYATKNQELLKNPEVKALYVRAKECWYTKEGLKKGDSLRVIGEKRKDLVILALAAEVRENYMSQNGTEKEYYKASEELQKAMKKAGLSYQYFCAVYSAIIYDCSHDHTVRALRRATQMQKDVLKSNDKRAIYITFRCNGIVYDMRGNYQLAMEYYYKALNHAKSHNMTGTDLGIIYADLAALYYSSRNYNKGLEAVNKTLENSEGDMDLLVDAYSKRCHLLFELNRYDDFMSAYTKLAELLKKRPEYNDLTECVWSKALFYLIKNNDSEARKLIYAMESTADSLDLEMTIAKKNGNYKKAYQLTEQYHEYLQNQQDKLDQDEILEMSSELGMAQLQNETDQLKANRQQMVYVIIIIVFILILVIAVTGVIHIYRRRILRQRRKIVSERELFYRNVAHQLRTPMIVVLGMVTQIKKRIINKENVEVSSIEAVERQGYTLLNLIKQLIETSKEGRLEKALMSSNGDIFTAPLDNKYDANISSTVNKSTFVAFSGNGTNNILVAEDNDDVALLICNMLYDAGYSVVRAADGQEAWEMMHDELPDLLLTDIAMPRMDGLALIRKVREDETMSHLPIIVVSARVEDNERIEGIDAGAEVYLAKPFINEELIVNVRRILQQREKLRKLFSNGEIVEDVESAKAEDDKHDEVITESEKNFIANVNSLIDSNMTTGEVTTQFLADKLYLSVSTLNRKLKNITGLTATIYIRTRRFIVAKDLLTTTNKSVAEIEQECGFSSQGYLTRLFKSETGLTPSEYRKEYSKI